MQNEASPKFSLKKNMGLFGIGIAFTKILTILIVPLFSFYIPVADYGAIDVISATVNLVTPIVALSIWEAVLRFLLSGEKNNQGIFTTGFIFCFIGALLSMTFVLISKEFLYKEFWQSVLPVYILDVFFVFFQTFSKGLGKTKIFVLSSVLFSSFSIGFEALFVILLSWGVNGYFLGMTIGYAVSLLFLFFSLKSWSFFSFKKVNRPLVKQMVFYSFSLMFANLGYWAISGSDKYITKLLMGDYGNGILSVVHKIPSLINAAYSIFDSAYCLSAFADHDLTAHPEEDREFFSGNFQNLLVILVLCISFVGVAAEPIVFYLFDSSYYEAWFFIPLYSYGVALGCLRGYFCEIYSIKKKTSVLMLTIFADAFLNTVSCYLLMRFTSLGLWATCISTIIGNGFAFFFFLFDSRKYVIINVNWRCWLSLALSGVQCLIPLLPVSKIFILIINLSFFLLLLLLNLSGIKKILVGLFSKKGKV